MFLILLYIISISIIDIECVAIINYYFIYIFRSLDFFSIIRIILSVIVL